MFGENLHQNQAKKYDYSFIVKIETVIWLLVIIFFLTVGDYYLNTMTNTMKNLALSTSFTYKQKK